ncbi:hypothetical protein BC829DRAFT_142281 [Chytridium lagenaria]|nr:hypothetical protein BC829DRAFT_142281 [Chytridium lagenaria]
MLTESRTSASDGRGAERTTMGSKKLVVQNLTRHVTEKHLDEVFGRWGKIASIKMPLVERLTINKGFAYVEYESTKSAGDAAIRMNGGQLDGVTLTVSIVRPPPPTVAERAREAPREERISKDDTKSRGRIPLPVRGDDRGGRRDDIPSRRRSPSPPPRSGPFRRYEPPSRRRSPPPRQGNTYRPGAAVSSRRRSRSRSSVSPPRKRRYSRSVSRDRRRKRSISSSSYSSYSRSSRSQSRSSDSSYSRSSRSRSRSLSRSTRSRSSSPPRKRAASPAGKRKSISPPRKRAASPAGKRKSVSPPRKRAVSPPAKRK